MTVKNATELLIHIEQTLGWVPDESVPLWKARAVQAGRLNKAIAKNPTLLTWRNLELAVAYLHRKRQPIKGPLIVTYVVEDALKEAADAAPPRPLGDLIDEAIAHEQSERSPDWQEWIGRLTRACGDYRQDAYDDWFTVRQSHRVRHFNNDPGKGFCEVCGRLSRLKKDGTIWQHAGQGRDRAGRREYRCLGVGQAPGR